MRRRSVSVQAGFSRPVDSVVSYVRAAQLRSGLNLSTIGAFGGRGMGQTCGAADPSQWMRAFGIDIDSRYTTEIIRAADRISPAQMEELQPRLSELFGTTPAANQVTDRSILSLAKIQSGRRMACT